MSSYQCIILAGGYGSRLGRITKKIPKPLIKVNNKPFILYLIKNLYRQGIKEFIILSYYKNSYFKKKKFQSYRNAKIKIIKENKKLGTLGSIVNAKKFLKESFFVVNGDSYFDFNIRDLEYNVLKEGKDTGIALTKIKSKEARLSYYLKNNKFKKVSISKKREKLVCGGTYYLKKKTISKFKKIELDIDKNLILNNKFRNTLFAKYYPNNFLDIGTPQDLIRSDKFLKKNIIKPCAFLDREGVFNYDFGYIHAPTKTKWKKNIFDAVKFLNDNNYRVIIITNQAGVANGHYSLQDFVNYTKWFHNKFLNKGSFIDEIYFSPFHSEDKIKIFKKKTNLIKPGNGMILNALKDWEINKNKSFLIGDKKTVIIAGRKSGIKSYLVQKNILSQVKKLINY